jgi:staphylococcal nuclease domain-containing protein 1
VEVTDITDATRFFAKLKKDGPNLVKIEKLLSELDLDEARSLEKPIRKGTLCAAKFTEDNEWYRAKVDKPEGKEMYAI